ncbi:MAG: hypothetical protein IT539_17005 [Bradyrhizobiaceae bacterium]|nr:hypothetical protein [Bradyrhizobiaceae bacterium]
MALRVLDKHRAEALEALCELIVPGSSRVGPVIYIDAVLATMPAEAQTAALGAIDALATDPSDEALARQQRTPEFGFLRALAIEAFYSDFVAPGKAGPGAWTEIDFQPPRAADLDRDWSYLEIER